MPDSFFVLGCYPLKSLFYQLTFLKKKKKTFLQQAILHKFLEKTKKKGTKNQDPEGESDPQQPDDVQEDTSKAEQKKLRKRVTKLIKRQKVLQVREIVKAQDESIPWGQENHVKVSEFVLT